MIQKNALGKGLGALLTGSSLNKGVLSTNFIQEIPLAQISVNPFQPRQDFDLEALKRLSESIKVYGIIQPITLRKLGEHRYELISGERRLQASKMANISSIPGYIRIADDNQMLEMALVENIQRENLNPIEIALSYQRLITECNASQQVIADKLGKDRTTVSNYLRLLKLPPEIQIGLRDSELSMGHARAIISIENPELQLQVFKEIVTKGLSVRNVEDRVRLLMLAHDNSTRADRPLPQVLFAMTQKVSEQLSNNLKTKVKISTDQTGKGEIKIKFNSKAELERLSILLQQQKNE